MITKEQEEEDTNLYVKKLRKYSELVYNIPRQLCYTKFTDNNKKMIKEKTTPHNNWASDVVTWSIAYIYKTVWWRNKKNRKNRKELIKKTWKETVQLLGIRMIYIIHRLCTIMDVDLLFFVLCSLFIGYCSFSFFFIFHIAYFFTSSFPHLTNFHPLQCSIC